MPTRVILIEDDDDIRLVLSKTLQFRFDVVDVGDARSALDILESDGEGFDVAVVDLWMPGMDGLTLIEKIQADEKLRDIAIIIITGIMADRDLPERFWTKNLKISGFFHKPFHPEDLVKKISDVMRSKQGLPPEEEDTSPRGGYL